MALNGLDVASYQSGLNVGQVAGADFVIVKATESTNYVNPACNKHVAQAIAAGKLFGVYHFARPGSAVAQADYFVSQVAGYIRKGILVLDWEANAIPLGPSWAKAWLDRVTARTGVRPIIYMSASVTKAYDWSAVVRANYGLWVAQYPTAAAVAAFRVPGKPSGVGHWPTVAIWQYTSNGRVAGWGAGLDLDVFYGDAVAWRKYAGASAGSTTPTPSKPSKPSTPTYLDVRRIQAAVRAAQDNIVGSDTRNRVSVVAQASNWGGVKFPLGVKFTQGVVGTSKDGIWGNASRAAHDKTVRNIQTALVALGYKISVDGIWGPATEKAVTDALNRGRKA